MAKAARVRDVLVLGGGPAGCATAIHCAQRGLQVTLLEAKAFPRHRPGETLHPGVEPILRQLGVLERVLAANFLRHEGNCIEWGGPVRFEAFGSDASGPWRGFQAWRATFDALLLDCVREAGVEIRQPDRATDVVTEDGCVTGVTTADGPLHARFTVDAAGGAHWLARQLRLPVRRHSPRLAVRYGYARGSYPERDEAPLIAADGEGWTWIARVQPDLYQWTRLTMPPAKLARDWRPEELRDLAPEGQPGAADATWRKVASVAGPGFFLVGDAAAVLDPAASHGVLKSLMSGMMAAHLIEQVLVLRQPAGRAAAAYEHWLSGWFETDVARLRELYAPLWPAFQGAASAPRDPLG